MVIFLYTKNSSSVSRSITRKKQSGKTRYMTGANGKRIKVTKVTIHKTRTKELVIILAILGTSTTIIITHKNNKNNKEHKQAIQKQSMQFTQFTQSAVRTAIKNIFDQYSEELQSIQKTIQKNNNSQDIQCEKLFHDTMTTQDSKNIGDCDNNQNQSIAQMSVLSRTGPYDIVNINEEQDTTILLNSCNSLKQDKQEVENQNNNQELNGVNNLLQQLEQYNNDSEINTLISIWQNSNNEQTDNAKIKEFLDKNLAGWSNFQLQYEDITSKYKQQLQQQLAETKGDLDIKKEINNKYTINSYKDDKNKIKSYNLGFFPLDILFEIYNSNKTKLVWMILTGNSGKTTSAYMINCMTKGVRIEFKSDIFNYLYREIQKKEQSATTVLEKILQEIHIQNPDNMEGKAITIHFEEFIGKTHAKYLTDEFLAKFLLDLKTFTSYNNKQVIIYFSGNTQSEIKNQISQQSYNLVTDNSIHNNQDMMINKLCKHLKLSEDNTEAIRSRMHQPYLNYSGLLVSLLHYCIKNYGKKNTNIIANTKNNQHISVNQLVHFIELACKKPNADNSKIQNLNVVQVMVNIKNSQVYTKKQAGEYFNINDKKKLEAIEAIFGKKKVSIIIFEMIIHLAQEVMGTFKSKADSIINAAQSPKGTSNTHKARRDLYDKIAEITSKINELDGRIKKFKKISDMTKKAPKANKKNTRNKILHSSSQSSGKFVTKNNRRALRQNFSSGNLKEKKEKKINKSKTTISK